MKLNHQEADNRILIYIERLQIFLLGIVMKERTRRIIYKAFQLGIFNTIRINLYYFGFKGLIHHYILCSRKVKLQSLKGNVVIKNPRGGGRVQLGFHMMGISDYKYERTIWQNNGEIIFDGNAYLGSGVRIVNSGNISFGNDVLCTGRSSFICRKSISVGADCYISWDCLIMDTDVHHIYEDERFSVKTNIDKKIEIGKHCWVGCRCLIKKETIMQDNTVLAAGSSISNYVQEGNCLVGNFGKIIKRNIYWHR